MTRFILKCVHFISPSTRLAVTHRQLKKKVSRTGRHCSVSFSSPLSSDWLVDWRYLTSPVHYERWSQGLTICVYLSFWTDTNSIKSSDHYSAVPIGSLLVAHLNGNAFNPHVHTQSCPCHQLHIAGKKGTSHLRSPLEERLVDTWHYLDKSSKRQQNLQKFQLQTGGPVTRILKHGPTKIAQHVNVHQSTAGPMVWSTQICQHWNGNSGCKS